MKVGSQDDTCGCSSMVEHQPSKLIAWVRFPSPAPIDFSGRTGVDHRAAGYYIKDYVPVAQLDRATDF